MLPEGLRQMIPGLHWWMISNRFDSPVHVLIECSPLLERGRSSGLGYKRPWHRPPENLTATSVLSALLPHEKQRESSDRRLDAPMPSLHFSRRIQAKTCDFVNRSKIPVDFYKTAGRHMLDLVSLAG